MPQTREMSKDSSESNICILKRSELAYLGIKDEQQYASPYYLYGNHSYRIEIAALATAVAATQQ